MKSLRSADERRLVTGDIVRAYRSTVGSYLDERGWFVEWTTIPEGAILLIMMPYENSNFYRALFSQNVVCRIWIAPGHDGFELL